jgi:hypothetical protein
MVKLCKGCMENLEGHCRVLDKDVKRGNSQVTECASHMPLAAFEKAGEILEKLQTPKKVKSKPDDVKPDDLKELVSEINRDTSKRDVLVLLNKVLDVLIKIL